METNNIDLHHMETLGHHLRAKFPEINEITAGTGFSWFIVYINDMVNLAPFVKALHEYLDSYIAEHGDPKEEYDFSVKRGNELIDILHYNNPDAAHLITMELFGRTQHLRVQDVMGATGDYTIFNEDFEKLGYLSAGVSPAMNPDGSLVNPDDMDNFYDDVYADFSDPAIWQISPEELKPYLNEILEKVQEQINSKSQSLEVNVDDPEDLAFWAKQFELSETDLRKAVLAAGKSIDDITSYLQK